ncbi:MAG TPA: hypothetical protein VMY98_01920 [Anaerolineae bacterium]|nr:hypothetical protein [Anaerolineae bacterium]
MKTKSLENISVPLAAEMVDEHMGPILQAARDGDLRRSKNVPVEEPTET